MIIFQAKKIYSSTTPVNQTFNIGVVVFKVKHIFQYIYLSFNILHKLYISAKLGKYVKLLITMLKEKLRPNKAIVITKINLNVFLTKNNKLTE